MRKKLFLIMGLAVMVTLMFGAVAQAEIVLGAISNRTAPTSDAGIPHQDGVLEAWKWINANGGVGGEKVKMVEIECGYNVPKTVAAFKRLVSQNKVPLVQGFGTPDSIAVIPFSTRTKTIYMPLSYAKEFVDAKNAPYYFVTNADYSSAGRSAVQFVKKNNGNLALVFNPGGFGEAPIADIKDEAKKQGVAVVAEENIGYVPTDAVQQVLKFKKAGAKYIWMGNTDSAMSVLAKDLAKQGSSAKLIGNIYGGTEPFIKNAGKDAEGHYAMYGSAPYGSVDTPAMKAIMASKNKNKKHTHFIRGWAQTMMVADAIRILQKAKKPITGPNLKWAFEQMKDYSPDGLLPPITLSKDDHRASMVVPVYQVQNGKWVKVWDNTLKR
jgi:branched-chain amino acid transport system substrate-binding protein